ncbi:integrase catalytic domain-containing protein [Trichonephila clavipes]|nr:integrase catalytic domain-containing protein [Trichonephila clavipes]
MDAANKAILERTKKTRSVSRSLVTKQINKLESEISNTADKTTVHEIYMQLISKFEELSTLDKEIENLIDIESLEEEIAKECIKRIEALEIEEISKARLSLPNPDAWAEMESKGFRLTFSCNESSENCEISLLIGSDFYWSLTHRIKRLDSSLVAVETRLGWSLQGKCDERSDCTLVHLVHSEEESISTELRRFWEIECLGILDKGSVTLGNGDEEILSDFDKSVNFVDGRYRVNLPWKPGMREALQNNKTVARKRFEGLVHRFKCDHELFCEYKDVIDDYVREGIVERTCDSLLDSQGFYLPHHAVIRSDKTTSRIRIVFDGSAHETGQSSLNQSLYTGPNLHPNILELLLCFRKSPVAFTADVKSAFLQIELDFRDRDFTRFFWTDNLNNEPYVLNFTRVLFGLRPSPYLLAATLKHHFKKYREQYPHTFELLNSSIYVDDLICGQNDVPDALRTTLECLQIFSDAGMLLRKWRSNSKQLNLLWQQEGVKTESSETSAIDLRPPTKVLGLAWDPKNDLIYFDPKYLLKFMSRRGESKRFILSVVGRIFDPIGILGPFFIKLKCLLQELWTLGVEWDSELPPKLRHKGNCKVIYSDNARTFKAAERELAFFANILKDSEFQNFVADKGIHWKFIVERAPWWGGFYERLVKTIKDPLRKILGRALLTFEELSTILSEVEVIVNHRPLTYVENDPGEQEPLTPAHFLELSYGDSKYPIHFIELIDATTAKESYKKRKTYRTLLLKQLWRRWKEQYLLQLKTANHFNTPSVHKSLKLNDVVLVEGNVKSKLLWELEIIKEIFIGRDDNVRSCLVNTFKGLFKKPIQLLYPL